MKNSILKFSRDTSRLFADTIGLLGQDAHSSHFEDYFLEKTRSYLLKIGNPAGRGISILDIGCGKMSYMSKISKSDFHYTLTGLDISASDISTNKHIDKIIVYDACNPGYRDALIGLEGKFDLIVSHSFLEHVPNPDITHQMIHFLLKKGGYAIHSYPTLYDPLLTGAHLLPNGTAARVLFFLEPFRKEGGKFRTYYRRCRGLSARLRLYYESLGYRVVEGKNFYGSFYLYNLFPIQMLMDVFYLLMLRMKVTAFATYSSIILQKE